MSCIMKLVHTYLQHPIENEATFIYIYQKSIALALQYSALSLLHGGMLIFYVVSDVARR